MRRLKAVEGLCPRRHTDPLRAGRELGRNSFTRAVDSLFGAARRHAPAIHRAGVVAGAALLYLYARVVALTSRLATAGWRAWPDVPAPCVLALWHGEAPSLIAAYAKRPPAVPVSIMVAGDPRGDCLALLCGMLGMRVVRGDGGEGGWAALGEQARELLGGSCAVVTADGGGPALEAKVGAVALASATGVPLVPLGCDCRPAVFERRKWDRARNPLPFGRVAVATGDPIGFHDITDAASLEGARQLAQRALVAAASLASGVAGVDSTEALRAK